MIEAGAKEVPEAKMIEAIFKAHEVNQEMISSFIERSLQSGKGNMTYESFAVPDELFAAIKEIVPPAEMEEAVFTDEKQTTRREYPPDHRASRRRFAENEEWLASLVEAVYQYQKKTVRKMILKITSVRMAVVNRQIRPFAAEVDLIPRVHGSGMFTRGQTQICK